MKNLIQHKTNLFQESLKYVIIPLKHIFIHGKPEDNMYYNPLLCFSQTGEMKRRDSDNATLTSDAFHKMDVNTVHLNHIIFSLCSNNHISIYIWVFFLKKKLPHYSNKYLTLTSINQLNWCILFQRCTD